MADKKTPIQETPNPSSDDLLFSIAHATVRHLNRTLFSSLSFQIHRGEQWVITGTSGSGKTALLQTIMGRFNITDGKRAYPFTTAYKAKYQITDPLFSHRNLMAFTSQQAHFKNKQNQSDFFYQQRYHSHFSEEAVTVATYLAEEQAKTKAHPEAPVRFSRDWIIEHLQLAPLLSKTLIQLSNGETRRLQIAYALFSQPLILLMDNPFVGLDFETRPVLEKILKQVNRAGVTTIMATSSREIPSSFSHIAHLQEMKIKYAGPRAHFDPRASFQRPQPYWQPDPEILEKIARLKPEGDHDFKTALKMENIHVKSGGKDILKNINWEVKKGEKWSLVGPNGAGKSTLLSLLSGDHPQAYANKIYLFDQKRGSGESIWELKRRIGFVSPEMHQYFRGNGNCTEVILSGLDNTMGFRHRQSEPHEIRLAAYWLQLLHLESLHDQAFRNIPTGEQRLILLIRAMIQNPPLLILDEPCQGLDEQQKAHFKHLINRLWDSPEKTLLYVSHYKEDIPSSVEHVLRLEHGEERAVNSSR